MPKLSELLADDGRREALTADLVALVEHHIAGRSGLRGVTLRTAMAAVRRRLPDAIPRAVTRLLPDLVAALEPLEAQSGARDGKDFASFLEREPARVAETILGIADGRVERSSNTALKAFYARFRGTAEHEAEGLIPGLADLLARHLG